MRGGRAYKDGRKNAVSIEEPDQERKRCVHRRNTVEKAAVSGLRYYLCPLRMRGGESSMFLAMKTKKNFAFRYARTPENDKNFVKNLKIVQKSTRTCAIMVAWKSREEAVP